jgi:hypothetical protein
LNLPLADDSAGYVERHSPDEDESEQSDQCSPADSEGLLDASRATIVAAEGQSADIGLVHHADLPLVR